jgi:very-short-patch-repair endonuclease
VSDLEKKVYELLRALYPFAKIPREFFVKYHGESLRFDFVIPHLKVAVECQGEQHYRYVAHFHQTHQGYRHAKWHDSLKQEWAELNGWVLIDIPYNSVPEKHELLNRITKAVCAR